MTNTSRRKDASIAYSRMLDAPWLIGRVKNEKSDLDINNTCIYFFPLIWKIDKQRILEDTTDKYSSK